MAGILRSVFVIVAAVAMVGGGTYSYFSAKDSAAGTLSAGTLAIDLKNQNETSDLTFSVPNLAPGGTGLVNFDVLNSSSSGMAIQLRGAAFGAWEAGIDTPDNTLVKVTKVERWNGSAWTTLVNNSAGITDIFYDSPTGADTGNYVIPAGSKDQFQLTVKLDETTGDKYQGKTYDATLKVQARQDGAPTWPTNLDATF